MYIYSIYMYMDFYIEIDIFKFLFTTGKSLFFLFNFLLSLFFGDDRHLVYSSSPPPSFCQSLDILLCIDMCFKRCAFCRNALEQCSHLNGFSPVCVRR